MFFKRGFLAISLASLAAISFCAKPGETTPDSWLKAFVYGGLPKRTTYPNEIQVLENDFYFVGYDNKYMNPAWVACRFKKSFGDQFTNFPRPKQTLWTIDRRTSAKVCDDDYLGAGYDRGHMAPNFGMMKSYGPGAQLDTFLLSNIVPQNADLNRYAWKDLEHQISATWLKRFGDLWVLTGPIYEKDPPALASGIKIPKAFYKIVLDLTGQGKPKVLGFIFPQSTPRNADAANYLVSIDEIERQTGFDFFSELEESDQNELESTAANQLW